ncbi:MAG: prephenate dehydrogenase/arogenate dehydrogenase family protein [Gemmataceae bacterium]|nr:prephenate dehydrogenase/arogenate dehydrogenase family protein [Gemmataceae bacterium]
MTLGIVGVGLLGGSLALAARARGLGRVLGHDRLPGVMLRAAERGMIEPRESLAALAAECELVVFCTPVDAIARQVLEAAPHCRPGTVLTDVGSTKAGIVRELAGKLPSGVAFVGGHPLAGSEKHGPEHSRADLFAGRLVLLTPADHGMEVVERFWHSLGARTEVIGAEEHDRALALTSHLPHLAAAALAGLLPPEWERVTATGFRDATRLAAGSPELWRAIFQANRAPLAEALGKLTERLGLYGDALVAGDGAALERLLEEARAARERLQ